MVKHNSREPTKPRNEARESKPEPEWRRKALETLSPEDRDILNRMRAAFEREGLNGEWLYEGAGTDLMPLFFAPDGAHLNFVDPLYTEYKRFPEKIGESELTRAHPLQTVHPDRAPVSEFEGDISISWIGTECGRNPELQDSYDVLYTNTIIYRDGYTVDDNNRGFRESLNDFLEQLADLPPENQQEAKQMFLEEFDRQVGSRSDDEIFDWMYGVDQETGEYNFGRVKDGTVELFVAQLSKNIALVKEIVAEYSAL